jgi:hypothetical protein
MPAAYATLDGTPANVTVSNGGLTATHSSAATNSGVSSTAYKSAGKYYFEVTVTATHGYSDMTGLMLDTSTFFDFVATAAGSKVGFGNALVYTNGSGQFFLATAPVPSGMVLRFAADLTARRIWIAQNNTAWNNDGAANPATGTNGAIIAAGNFAPAIGFGGSGSVVNDAMTLNVGASAFAFAAPAGFGNWMT